MDDFTDNERAEIFEALQDKGVSLLRAAADRAQTTGVYDEDGVKQIIDRARKLQTLSKRFIP